MLAGYHSTPHQATGVTLYEALMNRQVRTKRDAEYKQEIRDQGTESDHADWRQDIFINAGNCKLVASFFQRERSNDWKYICSLQALLPTDWWKSDSSVDGKPQGNCRQNSNSRDVVVSPPPFRAPPPEQARGLGLLPIGQVRLITQQENVLV